MLGESERFSVITELMKVTNILEKCHLDLRNAEVFQKFLAKVPLVL